MRAPPFFERSADVLAMMTYCILHLDDRSLYIFSEQEILLMIQAVQALVKNGHRSSRLYAKYLYRHTKSLFNEFYDG